MEKAHHLEQMPFFIDYQDNGKATIDVAAFEKWAEYALEEPNAETLAAMEEARSGHATPTSLEQLANGWETAKRSLDFVRQWHT